MTRLRTLLASIAIAAPFIAVLAHAAFAPAPHAYFLRTTDMQGPFPDEKTCLNALARMDFEIENAAIAKSWQYLPEVACVRGK